MSLADDLLAQSRLLANLDIRKPKQANLRRAISTTYYALFHLLSADAARRLSPQPSAELIHRIGRSFQHTEMKEVCKDFRKLSLPDDLRSLLSAGLPVELLKISKIFVELQEARHSADYDAGAVFSRVIALARVEDAELAFRYWRAVRNTDAASVFMAALAFRKRWAR